MTEEELDRLAAGIARALLDAARAPARPSSPSMATTRSPDPWLPTPVRPEPPSPPDEPPVWSGAAQPLSDVAPSVRGDGHPPGARVAIGELVSATRAAAAGKGAPPERAPTGRVARGSNGRTRAGLAIEVPIGVSNRHLHLSPDHVRRLFGRAELAIARQITQPGQFAAQETVSVVGPRGRLDAVRVVGPARGETQLEISLGDARMLGVDAPIAASGHLAQSAGGVTLLGPSGSVSLDRGVIVAARHLHLAPDDARRWGLSDGQRVDVECGSGARAVVFRQALVRSGPAHATELHLDADEASAAGIRTGDRARIVAVHTAGPARRVLVTERELLRIARSGSRLPEHALLTPSARDRARTLGLLAE